MMTLWKVQKLYRENEVRYCVLPYSFMGIMKDFLYKKRWKSTLSFLRGCRLFEAQAIRLADKLQKEII